jgi:hypothetical protein
MRPEPGSGPATGASLEPLIGPNGPHCPAGRAVDVGRLPKSPEADTSASWPKPNTDSAGELLSRAASAAKGVTYGFDGRGSTSQETTSTTLIATAISVGFGPSSVPRLCPACCPPLRCTTRFGLSRTLWRAPGALCSRSGLPPR